MLKKLLVICSMAFAAPLSFSVVQKPSVFNYVKPKPKKDSTESAAVTAILLGAIAIVLSPKYRTYWTGAFTKVASWFTKKPQFVAAKNDLEIQWERYLTYLLNIANSVEELMNLKKQMTDKCEILVSNINFFEQKLYEAKAELQAITALMPNIDRKLQYARQN